MQAWVWACALVALGAAEVPRHIEVEKTAIPLEAAGPVIEAEAYEPGFLVGDSNYHSIVAASDGRIYFSIDTHNIDYACRIYAFDPATGGMQQVAALDEVIGEDTAKQVSQGKIHTPFFEHEGKLWFSTHTANYAGDLPAQDSPPRARYSGGHFMSYDLATGAFEDLAQVMPNEGLITMTLDPKHEVLYGLTWPSGILVSYGIGDGELRYWGAVQDRGEWGHHPYEWNRICRTLGVDPAGHVYGSSMDGRIWRFDPGEARPVTYIDGLDLKRLPFAQSAGETLAGDFQYNWRVVEWNPETASFWGIQWETTTLFEFVPESNYVRAVEELRHDAYRGMPRNPEISQLGFAFAPDHRTILYLANGPAVTIEGRTDVQSTVYLFTFDIVTERLTNHGPVMTRAGQRVIFTESLAVGADGRIYTVAWVETIDPERREVIAEARKFGPIETERMIYEILLVQLPEWTTFRP